VFDELEHQLEPTGERTRLSLEFALDDDRYLDRICSSDGCGAHFKVHYDDLEAKVSQDEFHCPICGFVDEATEWNTVEQIDYMKAAAILEIQRQFGVAFEKSAKAFNRSQRSDGFITMSLSYKPSPLPLALPPDASEVMRQQSTCEACGMRYASVGAAFFCPACGHNSAVSVFDASLETVRRTLSALPHLHATMVSVLGIDAAEDAARHIRENALVKLVSSFQRLAEALFDRLPNRSDFQPRHNVFQNLKESGDLWCAVTGAGYEDMLSEPELSTLERYFQQRHLLAHKDGIVDLQYVERSGDSTYLPGQRLVIRAVAVEELGVLVQRLAGELRSRASDV